MGTCDEVVVAGFEAAPGSVESVRVRRIDASAAGRTPQRD